MKVHQTLTVIANKLAVCIGIIKLISIFIVIAIIYLFGFSSIQTQNQLLQPLFLGLIWLLLLKLFINSFARKLCDEQRSGCWFTIKNKVKNTLRYLVLLSFILVSLTACYFSIRLLSL